MSRTPDKPDIVGAAEAAQLLGVEGSRITRWREGGRMPKLAADLDCTPVWHRADIEHLRDQRLLPLDGEDGEFQFSGKLPLVGVAEAAEILGVTKRQVVRRRQRGTFPEPLLDRTDEGGLSAGPVWWRKDVVALKKKPKKTAARA